MPFVAQTLVLAVTAFLNLLLNSFILFFCLLILAPLTAMVGVTLWGVFALGQDWFGSGWLGLLALAAFIAFCYYDQNRARALMAKRDAEGPMAKDE